MRSSYKKLRPYIREVIEKNTDLAVQRLLGVSITKRLIPSIANIIGTDMSSYKIVRKSQFAYGPVTSRNGDKISVALLQDDECIISTSYTVFEIINHNELAPEYLMMWFRRPEFDRYARFKSHGSVREIFDWEEMGDVELPIPSIDKQREIVREYNTIVDRLKLNEQLNQKLEETAQALYKQWFVDFEFPISKEYAESIGKPELEGKPYNSNAANMIWNDELERDIPDCWGCGRLDYFAAISAGGDRPKVFSDAKFEDCLIPIYSNSTDAEGLYGFTNKAKIDEKSITVSARGAIIGYTVLRLKPFVPIVRLIVVTPKNNHFLNYLFESIKKFRYDDGASAQGQLTVPDISSFKLVEPDSEVLSKFQKLTAKIIEFIEINKSQNRTLDVLLEVLLSKMSKA